MPDLKRVITTYIAAWQELNPKARLDLLSQCFTEFGRYVDPMEDVHGRVQLSQHIGEILKDTGGRVELTSEPVTHHDVVHFTWHMVGGDGLIMVGGHDFARVGVDGKIVHLAGFFGDPEPLS